MEKPCAKKKSELDIKNRRLNWLIGKNSTLSLENKLIVYQQVIKPVWTYGCQLWGCAKPSIIKHIENFQNKILRQLVNAPWYIRNCDLHRDLGVNSVKSTIRKTATLHHQRLANHENPEARKLINTSSRQRRLRRTKPHDLVIQNSS